MYLIVCVFYFDKYEINAYKIANEVDDNKIIENTIER